MSSRQGKNQRWIYSRICSSNICGVCLCERERVRFCIDWMGKSAVFVCIFCLLQSLKIHLMLPPYAINYHFCLTLFGSFCSSGRTKQSHPFADLVFCTVRFFFSTLHSCKMRPVFFCCWFVFSLHFIHSLWLVLWNALVSSWLLSQYARLRTTNPGVDRLCCVVFMSIVGFHIVHRALILKFMTWQMFYFSFISHVDFCHITKAIETFSA